MGAVRPLEAPSWLTAEPRIMARTWWPLRSASESRSRDEHADALRPAGAVGRLGEGLAAPVGGEAALAAEVDEDAGSGEHRHPPGQGQRALAAAQRLGGQVHRHQRGGAGGVDGDRRALEAEGVGDAAGDDAGRVPSVVALELSRHAAGSPGSMTPAKTPVRLPRSEAGSMPASSSASQQASSSRRCWGSIASASRGAMPKNSASKSAASCEEAALAGVAGAGMVGVGVVEALEVPAAVGGELGDRVAALGDAAARAPRARRPRRGSGRPCRRSRSARSLPPRSRSIALCGAAHASLSSDDAARRFDVGLGGAQCDLSLPLTRHGLPVNACSRISSSTSIVSISSTVAAPAIRLALGRLASLQAVSQRIEQRRARRRRGSGIEVSLWRICCSWDSSTGPAPAPWRSTPPGVRPAPPSWDSRRPRSRRGAGRWRLQPVAQLDRGERVEAQLLEGLGGLDGLRRGVTQHGGDLARTRPRTRASCSASGARRALASEGPHAWRGAGREPARGR